MNWIPISKVLHRKPEVYELSRLCRHNVRHVVGTLIEVWAWFDDNACDGIVRGVSGSALARLLNVTPAFLDAMIRVGWLIVSADQVRIPNAQRWSTLSSKERQRISSEQRLLHETGRSSGEPSPTALASSRPNPPQPSSQPTNPAEPSAPTADGPADTALVVDRFLALWNEAPGLRPARDLSGQKLTRLVEMARDPLFWQQATTAIRYMRTVPFYTGRNKSHWKADVEWFLRPGRLVDVLDRASPLPIRPAASPESYRQQQQQARLRQEEAEKRAQAYIDQCEQERQRRLTPALPTPLAEVLHAIGSPGHDQVQHAAGPRPHRDEPAP